MLAYVLSMPICSSASTSFSSRPAMTSILAFAWRTLALFVGSCVPIVIVKGSAFISSPRFVTPITFSFRAKLGPIPLIFSGLSLIESLGFGLSFLSSFFIFLLVSTATAACFLMVCMVFCCFFIWATISCFRFSIFVSKPWERLCLVSSTALLFSASNSIRCLVLKFNTLPNFMSVSNSRL